MAEFARLALKIDGMHCAACIRRVTGALDGLAGVRVQSVQLGTALLEYNPAQVSPTAIAAAVSEIGFEANVSG